MASTDYPAISIRQPWAELILLRRKTIEIRSWRTDYRGYVWLHTGVNSYGKIKKHYGFTKLYTGGYVGMVRVVDCRPMDEEQWEEWRTRHMSLLRYKSGRYAWLLESPVRLPMPIDAPGKLFLFTPTDDDLVKLKTQTGNIRRVARR